MADKQQQFRGLKTSLPELLEGELGFCTDTGELYIGTGEGNLLIASAAVFSSLGMTATAAENMAAVSTSATLAVLIAAVNDLLSKLKAAGLMVAD